MAAFNLPGGFGMGMMGPPRGFEEQYHCYPVSFQVRKLTPGEKGRNVNLLHLFEKGVDVSVGKNLCRSLAQRRGLLLSTVKRQQSNDKRPVTGFTTW